MYLALRIISASMALGYFISRSFRDSKIIFLFPLIFAVAGGSLFIEYPSSKEFNTSKVVIDLVIGLFLGTLFSTPILAIDYIAKSLNFNFSKRFDSSLHVAIVLGLLIPLLNLDYLPYFYSILIKTKGLNTHAFLNSNFILGVGSVSFLALAKYLLLAFAVSFGAFILYSALSGVLPGFLNLGVRKVIAVFAILTLAMFYISSADSFFS